MLGLVWGLSVASLNARQRQVWDDAYADAAMARA
jgi:hypothetical protein